jgi:lycopene beta-cyclase
MNTKTLIEANFGIKSTNSFKQTRFQFYDTMLLQIIKTEPERIQDVMGKLFRNNELTTILKFLDEETSVLEDLKIFTKLPIPLFLNQVKQYMNSRI